MSLFQDFQSISLEEWKNKIINDIKGKDYQDTLVWETEEEFNVQPVYNKESLIDNKSKDYLLNKTSSEWEIREHIEVTDIDKANKKATKALQGGANSIQFNGIISSVDEMRCLLSDIMIEIISIHFYNSNPIQTADFLNQIIKERNLNISEIKASVSYDYLGELLISGAWQKNEQADFDTIYDFIKNSSFSNITINGQYYSNAGANNSQEIAYAFSQAIEYIHQLTERGMTADEVISKINFNFGINSNYFFEIAKIRAAKIVWKMIAESYGACVSKTNIHCQTSTYNLATQDSYTNLLRTTTEAMSAIIGGCNSLSVTPFNDIYESSSDFSSRIARNIQIILKEESFLDKVNDVAKGSYYIETLTDKMVEQILNRFKEIENTGGFLANILNGNIQDSVKATNLRNLKKYQESKKTLLGVNKYPNNMEKEVHHFISTQKIKGNEVEVLEQVNLSEKIKESTITNA